MSTDKLAGQVSVIVPVFNEETYVCQVIDRVLSRPEPGEVIVIDDASSDGTVKQLETYKDNPRVKLLYHDVNQGKGAAVTYGISSATLPYVIIQDADFEYDTADYPTVLAPLAEGKAEVVYGSRFMGTPGRVRYFRHEMGNKLLTFISNVFTDIHLSDMETCYKAFKREVIQNINLSSKRFGIEVEFTAKIAKSRRLNIYEVPISYNPRRYNEGKKITWKDGISALYHIVKINWFENTREFYKKPWDDILGPPQEY